MNESPRIPPLPFILPAVLSLLFALAAGLIRLPWALPFGGSVAMLHGPLMVAGFLGTVIAVERAAALGRAWAWLAPALNGLGALLMLFAAQLPPELPFRVAQVGAAFFALGGLGLVIIFIRILRLEPKLHNVVMTLGALAYFNAGLALLAGRPVHVAVPLWSAFLVLTIAGERLELNRFLRPKRGAGFIFGLATAALAAGAVAGQANPVLGDRVMGFAFFVLGAWLMMNDIARRTVRMAGVTRYTAVCLLSGYVWLVVSGLSMLARPGEAAGLHYDANLHALYVGFVLTMIFGHAPIIVPALTSKAVDYRGHFYLPLVLLHVSLLMRMGGDHAQSLVMRRWGGLLNTVALLMFLVVLLAAIRRGNRARD